MSVNTLEAYNFADHLSKPIVFEIPERSEAGVHSLESTLKLGEARANKLRYSLNSSDTSFSRDFRDAMDHPVVGHHGHHHSRHVEKLTKVAACAINDARQDLFDGNPEVIADISATMLFPYFHDIDQQMGNVRNLSREDKPPLKVKKGHGPGAAVMILAMTQKYAEVNKMTYEEAFNITGPAAIMMLRHDEPEVFDQTFSEGNAPATTEANGEMVSLSGEELLKEFEADTIDIRTISPAQILELTTMIKRRNKFMDHDESSWGLAPSFELEFKEEIEALQNNNIPVLSNISDARWERLKLLTEASYFADMGDMIAPFDLQLIRTLQGQYSLQRDFSFFQQQSETDWNGYSSREERLNDAVNMVLNCRGNDANSDDIRLLWELVHVKNISEQSGFGNLPQVHQFVKDHVIMSALFMKSFGRDVMKGGIGISKQVNKVFDDRQNKLTIQKNEIEFSKNIVLNGLYTSKKEFIDHERQEVIDILVKKHKPYSDTDIDDYGNLVDRIIQELQVMYEVTDEEMAEYEQLVQEGIDPPSLPFKNDSLPVNNLVIYG